MESLKNNRRKFHEIASRLYDTNAPEVCWLFDMALHIDPRTVVQAPLNKKTYKVFILDENGKRILRKGEILNVTRKFTPEQAKIVRQWWPLIPDRNKV